MIMGTNGNPRILRFAINRLECSAIAEIFTQASDPRICLGSNDEKPQILGTQKVSRGCTCTNKIADGQCGRPQSPRHANARYKPKSILYIHARNSLQIAASQPSVSQYRPSFMSCSTQEVGVHGART